MKVYFKDEKEAEEFYFNVIHLRPSLTLKEFIKNCKEKGCIEKSALDEAIDYYYDISKKQLHQVNYKEFDELKNKFMKAIDEEIKKNNL